jgi:hypothetical protein
MKSNYTGYIPSIVIALIILVATASVAPAQVNTLYHMKTVATRHELNPSFQPLPNGYFSVIPVLAGYSIGIGNNSLSVEDLLYPKEINGTYKTIWFYHKEGSIDDFYNRLKSTTRIFYETDFRLFAFGIRMPSNSYLTVGLNTKINMGVSIPKDLAKLVVIGMPEKDRVNSFNFDRLGISENLYSELAVGYSRAIDKNLTVGGKFKLLAGHANTSLDVDKFRIDASRERLVFDIKATLNSSVPNFSYDLDDQSKIEKINTGQIVDRFKISDLFGGFGIAFDLGVNYKLLDNKLNLSASLLDLGFIGWNAKNADNISIDEHFEFDGIEIEIKDGTASWDEDYFNNILEDLDYTVTSSNPYLSALAAKVLLGAEYGILNNYLTFGALSKSTIIDKTIFQEITASVNYLQFDYFNASLSYSLLNGRFSSIGLGLGGRLGPVNLYLASDYLPAHYTKEYIPYKSKAFNFQMGILFNFGYSSKKNADDDNDGVQNRRDKCPNTPPDAVVDGYGCSPEQEVEN